MAIAIAFPGFNDLGRSLTPMFLFMDNLPYQLSVFIAKHMTKIYRLEVFFFFKMHHRIPFFSALRSSVRQFQIPLDGLSFVTFEPFGESIYAADPLLQNTT